MDKYQVLSTIAAGAYGTVSTVRRLEDGSVFVWKEICYAGLSLKERKQLITEASLLRDLRHPNIVEYIDRIVDSARGTIYLVMEHCTGGDLGSLLLACRKKHDFIAEDVIWKLFMQIVSALKECHCRDPKVIHRDIKPGNVFLDAAYNVKIGDFGLARVLGDQSQFAETRAGSPYYMSPEQLDVCKYDESSDIWSLGCLLYQTAALQPPFRAENPFALEEAIKKGEFPRIPSRYSEDLHRVICMMLSVDHKRRPTVLQLLDLPQVALRVRERQVRERMAQIKARHAQIEVTMASLKERERQLGLELLNYTDSDETFALSTDSWPSAEDEETIEVF
jgi:NIMA (never in mitosis gene a)-related kinase